MSELYRGLNRISAAGFMTYSWRSQISSSKQRNHQASVCVQKQRQTREASMNKVINPSKISGRSVAVYANVLHKNKTDPAPVGIASYLYR